MFTFALVGMKNMKKIQRKGFLRIDSLTAFVVITLAAYSSCEQFNGRNMEVEPALRLMGAINPMITESFSDTGTQDEDEKPTNYDWSNEDMKQADLIRTKKALSYLARFYPMRYVIPSEQNFTKENFPRTENKRRKLDVDSARALWGSWSTRNGKPPRGQSFRLRWG